MIFSCPLGFPHTVKKNMTVGRLDLGNLNLSMCVCVCSIYGTLPFDTQCSWDSLPIHRHHFRIIFMCEFKRFVIVLRPRSRTIPKVSGIVGFTLPVSLKVNVNVTEAQIGAWMAC